MHVVGEEELACTLLRVPPLAHWAVRRRVRTSGLFRPHAMPSVAHAALGTSCSVACEPAARHGGGEPPAFCLIAAPPTQLLSSQALLWGLAGCACHANMQKYTLFEKDPLVRQAAPTRANPSHGEAVRLTMAAWGSTASGSPQVLPNGLDVLPRSLVSEPRNAG